MLRHQLRSNNNTSIKTGEQITVGMTSAKLEDSDVKGAVRLLCSDDRLAVPNDAPFTKLSRLHPTAPADRRPAPLTITPPLQVLPDALRTVIQSFQEGSAAGLDRVRSQYLKDLLIRAAVNNPLLLAVTDLINLLLESKTPIPVRRAVLGATLLTIAKK